MRLRTMIAHLSITAVFALCVSAYALSREKFSFEMMASVLFGGFLFYAARHLLWAAIVLVAKLSNVVSHAGFIACTAALGMLASFWFFPPDPSGLPLQWMLYWPLALILLVCVVGGTAAYVRSEQNA